MRVSSTQTLKKTHRHTLTDSRHGLGGNMTAVPEGHISLYTETTDSVCVCVSAVFKAELQKDVPFFRQQHRDARFLVGKSACL